MKEQTEQTNTEAIRNLGYCNCKRIKNLKNSEFSDLVQREKENVFSCANCNKIIHHKTYAKLQENNNI